MSFVDNVKDKFWGCATWWKDKAKKVFICCGAKQSELDEASNILAHGFVKANRSSNKISSSDNQFLNRAIVASWPFFALYLCTQPWISNWANNAWFHYSAEYTVYNKNGSAQPSKHLRPGMCDTPADTMFCTDGQNFTELAIRARGKPVGCGCGQGILGEGLCPMTFYGYTLSDYVSTEPGIAAMLGLGFFPLLGTWRNTMFINKLAKPTKTWQNVHMYSMLAFQISYLIWGIASDCIFPNTHSVFTVLFLGAFLVHWVVTALICVSFMGVFSVEERKVNVESLVTVYVAIFAVAVISIGAIPRVFITLNSMGVGGGTFFPNLNRNEYWPIPYAFWFAEAIGLSATFGAYPIVIVTAYFFPEFSDFNNDNMIDQEEAELFALVANQFGDKRVRSVTTSNSRKQLRGAYARETTAMGTPLLS